MTEFEIIDTNEENISKCGFCGYKNNNNDGHKSKTAWLKKHYKEGIKFKVLRSHRYGDVGMIEYVPGNSTWRPINAKNYLVIHCIMVMHKYQGKGYGEFLLDDCLREAKKRKCHGVAVVTSSGSFMAGKGIFAKSGFQCVDSASGYDLLVKKFSTRFPNPTFVGDWNKRLKNYGNGLTILTCGQCPMIPKWSKEILEASRKAGLKARVIELEHSIESRNMPSPYGIFSIVYDGKLIAGQPISARRFSNIINKTICGKDHRS